MPIIVGAGRSPSAYPGWQPSMRGRRPASHRLRRPRAWPWGAAGARQLARQQQYAAVTDMTPGRARSPIAAGGWHDDWAKRKGQTYRTIIVELEQRCPVDVLPDRSAESIATWLKAHPEVRIVTHDRAEAYASGLTQRAPDTVQVADRWHLMKNLWEAVKAELHQRPRLPWRLPPATVAEPPTCIPSTPATADLLPVILPPPLGAVRKRLARCAAPSTCISTSRRALSDSKGCGSRASPGRWG
jgi:Transposase